jgi:hypothetical protein
MDKVQFEAALPGACYRFTVSPLAGRSQNTARVDNGARPACASRLCPVYLPLLPNLMRRRELTRFAISDSTTFADRHIFYPLRYSFEGKLTPLGGKLRGAAREQWLSKLPAKHEGL